MFVVLHSFMDSTVGAAAVVVPPPDGASLKEADASSPEELEALMAFFDENKAELESVLNEEGSAFLRKRSESGYVGLINQAATCYLNSLLQTLFTTPELRHRVYAFRYNSDVHGPADRCIPLQLQELFARLQFGSRPATATTALTHAFGWSRSQGAQQQDVQELCMVLFEALDRFLEQSGGGPATKITDLYRGRCQNFIRSLEAAAGDEAEPTTFCKYHPDPFLTLSLPVKGVGDVGAALQKAFEPDVLDGDNQYFCEDLDKKIDAEKGSVVESLPPILMLHLKRFDFDYETLRRVKVNDRCAIPEIIDMDTTLAGAKYNVAGHQFGAYELASIMNHSGSAAGGHYRAFVRGDRPDNHGKWFDFNDAHVSEMSEAEVARMFGRDDGAPTAEDTERAAARTSGSNAYLLCYRRRDTAGVRTVPMVTEERAMLPDNVREKVEAENSRYERLFKAHAIREQLLDLRVFTSGAIGTVQGADLTLHVPRHFSLQRATALVHDKLFASANQDSAMSSIGVDRVRLRAFDAHASAAGKTFGGHEQETLRDLGLGMSNTMMLEVREADAVFEEYNPNEMLVRISRWNTVALAADTSTSKIVRVEGDQQATVGQLRAAVSVSTGMAPETVRLIRITQNHATVLEGDGKEIKRAFSIWSGEEVILEPCVGPEDVYTSGSTSAIVKQFEDTRNRISINFNPLGMKTFDHTIVIDKRLPLSDLKIKIAEVLAVEKVDSFRLKLHERAPILKELGATIGLNGLSDGSVVFVEKGIQPKENDVILAFYRYDPNSDGKFVALARLIFDKGVKIKDIKARLAKHPKVGGHPATQLRLRERKKAGKDVGTILRDDEVLSRCIKRVGDGDKLAVTFLDNEEEVTTKDVIVDAREWKPLARTLGKKTEIVVSKFVTLEALAQVMQDTLGCPKEEALQVAKVRTGAIDEPIVASRTLSGKGLAWVSLNVSCGEEGSEPMLAMKSKLGRIADGDHLLVAASAEVAQLPSLMPASPAASPSKATRAPFRPPLTAATVPPRRFPQRKEAGVKIATFFDSPVKEHDENQVQ